MKFNQWDAFEKHLESASPSHLADVYLLLSKDGFERNLANRLCRTAFQEKGCEIQILQGQDISAEQLLEELANLNLFSTEKVVVIVDLDEAKKPVHEAVVTYLSNEERPVRLILTASSFASNTKVFKSAEKTGVVLDLAKEKKPWEKEKELEGWMKGLAQKEGKTLDPAALRLLFQQVGPDRATLYQEFEKLVCYTGDRNGITRQDVEKVIIQLPLDTIWKLGEAIFSRNGKEALRIGKELLDAGTQPLGLIPQLRRQTQTDFQVLSILEGGGSPQDVTAAFPYMRGGILQKHLQAAKSYGKKRFRDALLALDRTELRLKNSAVEPELLFETLLIKLTS